MRVRLGHRPLVAALVALAGCGGTGASTAQRPRQPLERRPGLVDKPTGSQLALLRRNYPGWDTDFTKRAVRLSQFDDGGPPRDGIPPIDHPRPVSLYAGDRFLARPEPVIAVRVGRQVRAYPEQILVWHEIVNDTLGGKPVAITYCPLCNSALAFDRRVGARTLTFGTTGKLRNSDLVMWDGERLVILYARGIASALDARAISRSRDVGTAGAFDPRVRGRALRFVAIGTAHFRDLQTGSTWDVTGRAVAGALRGARLRALRHDEQFWFALAAFLPHARLLA